MSVLSWLRNKFPSLGTGINMLLNPGNNLTNPAGSNPLPTYSGSDISGVNSDFLGDWRSADGWMRFDMQRVRSRSRQLERGNNWCRSFKHSLLDNVVGHSGFSIDPNVVRSSVYGDTGKEGTRDEEANRKIRDYRKLVEKKENFTTRKRLSAIGTDRLQIARLCFDGEVIFRRIKKFGNEVGYSWQMIDPDYLDHNLNRLEPNGNYTRMGVELDKDYKFPVAYWFFYRRPNDYMLFNTPTHSLYERVPADEIVHIYVQTEDSEQTRGWPWIFAAAVQMNRMGKYEEAALINAAIGASKMGFYTKEYPTAFEGDLSELTDNDMGSIIDEVAPGSWHELPLGVKPINFDFKYPSEQYATFERSMLKGISSSLGCSYMGLSGDVADANFSNLRAALDMEHDHWKGIQNLWIHEWKIVEYDESIYRGLLTRKLDLPVQKFAKFNNPRISGRRWSYVNPLDDQKANEIALGNCTTSPQQIIREQGGEPEEVMKDIAEFVKWSDENGIFHPFGAEQVTKRIVEQEPEGDDITNPEKRPTEKKA